MFPTIHNFDAPLDTQGYGALSDCISCEVTEELNGAFTLEMKYPLHGIHNEYLTVGNIIMVKPNHNQGLQAFRINQVKQSFANAITVYANHISYDMSGYPIRSARTYNSLADTIAAMNALDWSSVVGNAVYHQFTFDTDKSSNVIFKTDYIRTLRSWMGGQEGSIIDVYGGEWSYDNFNCFLASRRGEDNGVRISYGKNLAEYTKERTDTLYSHICAYWKKSEDVAYGNYVSTGINCTFRCAYYDASNDFEDKPTTAQLDALAESKASGLTTIAQTITVTPAQLGNKIIGLGDTVYICYEQVFTTRVIKTVWDALGGYYTKLELGTKKANIAETIKSVSSSGNSGMQPKSKSYSGTLNSYGCIQTDLKPEKIVLDAKTAVDPSFQCTPLIAGGWWWIRAVDWATGNKGSGSITVTVDYL